ncbi:MAG: NADH-quinone oxidoreductase subunit NuoF [Syntrophales bacterium]|jgi:NADH-quinone oxidoreductase subunit F
MNFEAIKKKAQQEWEAFNTFEKPRILVGAATCGRAAGAMEVWEKFKQELASRSIDATIIEVGDLGLCYAEPCIEIAVPDGRRVLYGQVTEKTVPELVEDFILKGNPRPDLALCTFGEKTVEGIPTFEELPMVKKQVRVVLRNSGIIDPSNIYHYIARGGYSGLSKALQMDPGKVIEEIKSSGLRGRGGAGFPTGVKWGLARGNKSDVKYIICNADEGDPGAFMDRAALESDPHAVLEGLAIGAYAIGANYAYVYARAEYPLAIERIEGAIQQMEEHGFLGKNILGAGFDLTIKIKEGAGAFVCGEETALMASIEGKSGRPRPRPPFPAQSGVHGKPTNINNVETLANVSEIMNRGASWFASYGTEKSKGTKTFALAGKINRTGLIEVPMGITLGDVIFDVGGGILNDKRFKAVQTGGPSGGCLSAEFLDMPVDYDELAKVGSIMGSGGMIVMDEDSCIVDIARYFLSFTENESCGKCTPCRMGTQHLLRILTDITQGKGKIEYLALMERIGKTLKSASLCALGQTVPNPILSTMRYFRNEYEEHILDKKCRAVVCSALFKSPCQHTCPAGMDVPAYVALIRAERFTDAYKTMLKTNPFPSVCGRVCDHKCQAKCRRGGLDEPIAIKFLKRFITDNAPRPQTALSPATRKEKIAVIGAGPAGLTAARDLALRGYKVTVFEELSEPGGMLRWAIPAYRLPRNVLADEIKDNIASLGVDIKCNTRVGKDLSFDQLNEQFDYIYLATGAHKNQPMGIPGEDLKGVFGGVEFLRDFNANEKAWTSGKKTLGSKVAVIGGGNSAIDAARVAFRLGADVTILYRRERKDMPASEEEIHAAEEEGIKIEYLVVPLKIEEKNGKVSGITCQRTKLDKYDKSGRKRPVAIAGSEFTLNVNTVIAAIGQVPDMTFIPKNSGVSVNKWSTFDLASGSKSQTTDPKCFAGGDAVTGPATVIGAIAAGHQAASDIDSYIRKLNGEPAYVEPLEEKIDVPLVIDEESEEKPQAKMPELHVPDRKCNFKEVELGYQKTIAVLEACRCLRCDAEIAY